MTVIEGAVVDTEVEATKKSVLQIRSNYFDMVMDDPERIIREAREQLEDVEFDTFVVTGMSGVSVASLLAHALGKNYLIIRKPDDLSTHSSRRGVGKIGKRWVFLDDFICSGDTKFRVMRQLATLLREAEINAGYFDYETSTWVNGDPFDTEYVGDYLYAKHMTGPGCFDYADECDTEEWLRARHKAEQDVNL